jgi:hypothetical protein
VTACDDSDIISIIVTEYLSVQATFEYEVTAPIDDAVSRYSPWLQLLKNASKVHETPGLLADLRVTLYLPQEHASCQRATKCFLFGPFSVIISAGSSAMLELRKAVGVSLFVAEGGGKWNNQ